MGFERGSIQPMFLLVQWKNGWHLQPWAPKPIFLEVFMVNNLVFRWPKPLFFMVLGAHIVFFPFSGHFPVNHDCGRKSTGLVNNFIELE